MPRLTAACKPSSEAAAAARAARSPEEIEEERKFMDRHRGLFAAEIGYPRTRHRARPEIPREITDEVMVELLALLGPDLGDQGEEILRRVARDAPAHLGPAVEELGTGLCAGRLPARVPRGADRGLLP